MNDILNERLLVSTGNKIIIKFTKLSMKACKSLDAWLYFKIKAAKTPIEILVECG